MNTIEIDENILNTINFKRESNSKKGDNGRIAIIGGSRLYHGAPLLSALAGLRTGVDLAYIFAPKEISNSLRSYSPNVIVRPYNDNKITKGVANQILKSLPKIDAVVIGTGLGKQRTDGIKKIIEELSKTNIRIILDADILQPEIIEFIDGKNVIMTPHIGEFNRLFKLTFEQNDEKIIEEIQKRAIKSKSTILLKGKNDIICNEQKIGINKKGNPGMTVGGTGDVLTGILAALITKTEDGFTAACAAAYINTVTGEHVFKELGYGFLATDIINKIPIIIKEKI